MDKLEPDNRNFKSSLETKTGKKKESREVEDRLVKMDTQKKWTPRKNAF